MKREIGIILGLVLLVRSNPMDQSLRYCFLSDGERSKTASEENGIAIEEDYPDNVGKMEFSFDLFHNLRSDDEEMNLFFSPHIIHQALTMALFGAKGETEQQLREVLRVNQTKLELVRKFLAETKVLRNSSGNSVELAVANRLFFSEEEPVRMCMRATFENDQIQFLDFKKSDEAERIINKWVEAETKGKIKDIIPKGELSPMSRIALASSVYFKGRWEQEFDKTRTKQSLFYVSPDKITQTQMMYLKGNFKHGVASALQSYIIDLPYKGNSHSMIILLPPFVAGSLNETISRLTADTFYSAVENLRYYKNEDYSFNDEVEIYFPKFKTEQTIQLTEALRSIGVVDLFNPEASNLTDFSEKPGLAFDSAIHKSYIEVNEEGSEAAAATIFLMSRQGRLHPLTKYEINRPFAYFVIDNTKGNEILFSGIFKTPKTAKIVTEIL
ncbi:unnamed protein product [Allacma fusca]|uniref:Serpin domain-containing protein n=1 Tax=Allacma fusca TaxID=39272 RepID=A0A8J2NRB7_9HEXA|nr:unnamed protein product [Allacma fusca]